MESIPNSQKKTKIMMVTMQSTFLLPNTNTNTSLNRDTPSDSPFVTGGFLLSKIVQWVNNGYQCHTISPVNESMAMSKGSQKKEIPMTLKKELKKLMKKNKFELIRQKNHLVWQHIEKKCKVTTSSSPSCKHALKNIMKDIQKEVGFVVA